MYPRIGKLLKMDADGGKLYLKLLLLVLYKKYKTIVDRISNSVENPDTDSMVLVSTSITNDGKNKLNNVATMMGAFIRDPDVLFKDFFLDFDTLKQLIHQLKQVNKEDLYT